LINLLKIFYIVIQLGKQILRILVKFIQKLNLNKDYLILMK